MNKSEAATILSILKVGYPNFYKDLSGQEVKNTINLWTTMFANDSALVVTEAVKALMCTLKFPPTIADVKEKIALITQPEVMTEIEAWSRVKGAMSYYNAGPAFEGLDPILQRLVGSPSQLREWAVMDVETINSVVQSNFMRSYRARAASEREYLALPESAKELIDLLAAAKSIPEYTKPTIEDFSRTRDRQLAQLEEKFGVDNP